MSAAATSVLAAYARWVRNLSGGTCREALGLAAPATVLEARAHAKALSRLLMRPGGRVKSRKRACERLGRFRAIFEALTLREPWTRGEAVGACERGLLDLDEAVASLERNSVA